MQTTTKPSEEFDPVERVAARLGVPTNWLKAQADAGKVPFIKVSNRRLFDLDSVRKALLDTQENTDRG